MQKKLDQEKLQKIRKFIEEGGIQVVGVENPFPLTYTIGFLEKFKVPEIAVTGMPIQIAAQLINFIRDELERGRKFAAEVVYRDFSDSDFPFIFRPVHGSHFDETLGTVMNYYSVYPPDAEFMIWQLFWSGDDRKFQWEDSAALRMRDQPRLDVPDRGVRDI